MLPFYSATSAKITLQIDTVAGRLLTHNAELSGGFVAERKTRPAQARLGPERTRATGYVPSLCLICPCVSGGIKSP